MNTKKVVIIALSILIIAVGALFMWQSGTPQTITSFDECVEAGYPIMESYPAQCRAKDGKLFVQDIGNELEKADLIRINSPRPNATVTTPIVVSGEARGNWFFEASFPVHLEDASGNRVVTGIAQAQGEWMTSNFVPFTTTLDVPDTLTGPATLVLQKDNPSGLPENDDELRVPIVLE